MAGGVERVDRTQSEEEVGWRMRVRETEKRRAERTDKGREVRGGK